MNFIHRVASVIDTSNLPKANADQATVQNVLNVVFALVGSITLLIIVIAGLRYITARGDPNAVSQAKKALIYAIIGLVITLVAYSIVFFVIRSVG